MTPQLEAAMHGAINALLAKQQPDGHWVFGLEADAAMTAEYVLQMHFLGEPIDSALSAKLAGYLSALQQPEGGWPLLQGGCFDLSTSVKTYFALKLLGYEEHDPALRRACVRIRQQGGAVGSNVMTRIWMALFGVIPWQALPLIPVEVILLPRWFPFHLSKIACLPRKYTVAFSMLHVLHPIARNPQRISIGELFLKPPADTTALPCAPHQNRALFSIFNGVDRLLHRCYPWFPKRIRQKAMDRALAYVTEQLNGEDGYGATLPTIGVSLLLLRALNYPDDHPAVLTARSARDKLLVIDPHCAYCQPCVSPIWDTAWACQALLETGDKRSVEASLRGLDWLGHKQILDIYGDWAVTRPHVRPGGWAFQYNLARHPDVDDTAVVATVMQRALQAHPTARYGEPIARAEEWVQGMQNRKGGWGAYEAENTQNYLNSFPIAEHGLMIDYPSADVSARCLCLLGQLGATPYTHGATGKALGYLLAEQEADGSWYGRWGINFIYGTWSALEGLAAIGYDPALPQVQQAREWLIKRQNQDGGWGEDARGYAVVRQGHPPSASNPSQTAWALLGLMAAGAVDHPATRQGIAYLQQSQQTDGTWVDHHATGTGIPRALYLHYYGYAVYFPLWALARYRNLSQNGFPATEDGPRYQNEILPRVSRTFALTIPQLPPELYSAAANAYLLYRMADTIEDEPALSPRQKQHYQRVYLEAVTGTVNARHLSHELSELLTDKTLQAERDLIRHLPSVLAVNRTLKPLQREAILDCLKIMTRGMAEFQDKTSLRGLASREELDRYCYYAAGVVGEMLTELFIDYEPALAPQRSTLRWLAVSFGTGLQLTNILKDQGEDRLRGICWLPRDLVAEHDTQSLAVAELIGTAHSHLQRALQYALLIPSRHTGIRRFLLWAGGLALLTLRQVQENPGAGAKVSHAQLRWVMRLTRLSQRSDLGLRLLYKMASLHLPLTPLGPAWQAQPRP